MGRAAEPLFTLTACAPPAIPASPLRRRTSGCQWSSCSGQQHGSSIRTPAHGNGPSRAPGPPQPDGRHSRVGKPTGNGAERHLVSRRRLDSAATCAEESGNVPGAEKQPSEGWTLPRSPESSVGSAAGAKPRSCGRADLARPTPPSERSDEWTPGIIYGTFKRTPRYCSTSFRGKFLPPERAIAVNVPEI